MAPTVLTIPKPDDWHVHLRDGAMLRAVLPFTERAFFRAVVMPNLVPPVTSAALARSYRQRILSALPETSSFTPLMAVYLTDTTDPDDLARGHEENVLFAAKLYPAGATTNAQNGVTDIQVIAPIFERMQKIGMPLLIHGEVVDPEIDIFDREAVFIDRILIPLRRSFPELKIVLEHITTRHAAHYVAAEAQNGKIAATITPHHLLLNRNDLFEGGMNPYHFCYPILKSEENRRAVVEAATSGAPMFFAGTDSAPHPRAAKESGRAPGGIFGAVHALSLYAEIFERENALDRLENFLSRNGASFHDLPVATETITLRKSPPEPLAFVPTEDGEDIVPFPADPSFLSWRIKPS